MKGAVVMTFRSEVEKWCIQEVTAAGRTDGNPFTDYTIKGIFSGKNETVSVYGFYDGDGIYKVRFMPSFEGHYKFTIEGTFCENAGDPISGEFDVIAPEHGNHGPVRVANKYHFAYEDGTPYYSVGTTCYVWELQSDDMIERTFKTLREGVFNKIRFCIFPKHYAYNLGEPRSYPYVGTPMDSSILNDENFGQYTGREGDNNWDFSRFNLEHFRHIERCIGRLSDMGIEADLIVMHPYDRWGFAWMKPGDDDLYWNYVIARFAAYRNVWWSLANEYDLMGGKTLGDWERYAGIICSEDPYNHLRSIHNCKLMYDYTRPWVTHCSIQRQDLYKSAELVDEYRVRYGKPVVMDEMAYEGDIQYGWGNITAQEMVRRFWEASCRGGYAGHSETYLSADNKLWWSHGGVLHGESAERLKFLHGILAKTPGIGLKPYNKERSDEVVAVPEEEQFCDVYSYYLCYYTFMQPRFRDFYFDDRTKFHVNVIDTWNMTVEDRGTYYGHFRIALPGKQYMAVQLIKTE
jgi:hypothetical protein